MPGKNYIPAKEADFVDWSGNLLAVARARKNEWKLEETQLTELDGLYAQFRALREKCQTAEYTKLDMQTKNETKDILKKRPEVFVWNNLQNNDAMTDNGREALRIPPFTTGSPVPGPRPDKVPETETETPLPRTVRIKFKGENASRWGKPEGVHSLECRWIIARSPPGLIEELVHSEFATRSLLELVFDEDKRGARLYFAVRWEGGNGKKGPWSEIFSVVIP